MFEWIYSIHPAWYVAVILYVLGTEVTYSLGNKLDKQIDEDDPATRAMSTAIMTMIWPFVALIVIICRNLNMKGK